MAIDDQNMRTAVEQWKVQALDSIHKKFTKRNIAMGELYNSIAINIISAGNGDVSKVQFSFNAYGRFVDMGVSRGYPLGSRKEMALQKLAGKNVKHGRKRKPFYTRDIFNQGHVLHEILVEQFGIKMFSILENSLPGGTIETTI